MSRGQVSAAVLTIVLAAASCTAGRARSIGAAPKPDARAPRLLVALGASDARGAGTSNPLRQAWPQDLFRLLPGNYRLVNLAIPDATLADALAESLPTAQTLHPAVAAIWLTTNDILSQVSPATYQAELATLVRALRALGATVLIGNAIPADALPAYQACAGTTRTPDQSACPPDIALPLPPPAAVQQTVQAYNIAIATVAAAEGARVVDLHAAAIAAQADGSEAALVDADGYNPSILGAQRIAALFAAADPHP